MRGVQPPGEGLLTKILHILVTSNLHHALLAGRELASAEPGTVGLVDDDAIGRGSRQEGEAIEEAGQPVGGRELEDCERVVG